MPIVQVQMLRGRSAAQKRLLIAELTRVVSEVAEVDPERVTVVIFEIEADSWGRGGSPLSEATVATKVETHAGR